MMKKALVIVFWVVLGIALVAILILAKNQNESQIAQKPNISIHVEGENAFGPFSKELVKRCRASSVNPDSPVCDSNRWSKGFLAGLARG